MARVETAHIHLHSSILHHTEGWETKSAKKKESKQQEHTETQGHAISTPASIHSQHTNTDKGTSHCPSLMKTHATKKFTVWIPQKQETDTFLSLWTQQRFYRHTHTHTHTRRHMIHFPAENDEIWNGALPLGMAVCPGLCWSSVTLSSTARKREGEKQKGRNS